MIDHADLERGLDCSAKVFLYYFGIEDVLSENVHDYFDVDIAKHPSEWVNFNIELIGRNIDSAGE